MHSGNWHWSRMSGGVGGGAGQMATSEAGEAGAGIREGLVCYLRCLDFTCTSEEPYMDLKLDFFTKM